VPPRGLAGAIAPAMRCACRTRAGTGACLRCAGGAGLGVSSAGGGNAVRFLLRPGEAKALSPLQWQGPSPLPRRHSDPWPAGGQSPRPAPAPPPAGASRPPVRALASRGAGSTGLRGTVPHGRGSAVRFLIPPGEGAQDQNPNRQRRCQGRGHRPCHVGTVILGQPGPKAPGQRPPRPRRALLARRGRALASVGAGGTGLGGSVPRGRGNAVRFLFPPGAGAEEQSPNDQPRCNGRGHRPCHSAPLIPCQPGAKAPSGRFPPRRVGRWPPVMPGPADLRGTVPRERGNAVRFLCPDQQPLFPGSGSFSHQAGGRDAISAPCQTGAARPRPCGSAAARSGFRHRRWAGPRQRPRCAA